MVEDDNKAMLYMFSLEKKKYLCRDQHDPKKTNPKTKKQMQEEQKKDMQKN